MYSTIPIIWIKKTNLSYNQSFFFVQAVSPIIKAIVYCLKSLASREIYSRTRGPQPILVQAPQNVSSNDFWRQCTIWLVAKNRLFGRHMEMWSTRKHLQNLFRWRDWNSKRNPKTITRGFRLRQYDNKTLLISCGTTARSSWYQLASSVSMNISKSFILGNRERRPKWQLITYNCDHNSSNKYLKVPDHYSYVYTKLWHGYSYA